MATKDSDTSSNIREKPCKDPPERTECSSTRPSSATTADMASALQALIHAHELDLSFPQELIIRARKCLQGDSNDTSHRCDPESAKSILAEFQEQHDLALNNSAYPEVRAVVDPDDDPTLPVGTFRVFVVGTFFCVAGTAIQQFFSLRMPSISISTYVVQLLSMPIGAAMAKYLPTRTFGRGWCAFSLNPGSFNSKEHLLIAIMANVAFSTHSSGAYIVSLIQVLQLDRFYGEKVLSRSLPWQVMMMLATQLIGYGCAGMARRFLVYPVAMVWRRPLSNIALTKALMKDDGLDVQQAANGWKMSRYRFFVITFCAMFVYYWIPNYLFGGLSVFNWPTWISPGNVGLAIIMGSTCGLGLNPVPTLDWNTATFLADPIITPLFTVLNFAAGMAVMGFIVTPLLYFNNVWNMSYLPINSNQAFDNSAKHYNVHRILNDDMTINEEAYLNYSIPYMSTTQLLNYAAYFTLYMAVPTHIFLWHRREIAAGIKSVWARKSRAEEFNDVHNRLMSVYKECPHWWYLAILAISFTLACISVSVWPTGMPIWGIVMALCFTIVVQIPVGMLNAITNMQVPTSILAQVIGGYALEGKAVPNMIFKMFSFMATAQSLNFVEDLKLAHYAKIPPRKAFAAQLYATVVAAFVALGVNHWSLRNIDNICDLSQPEKFTCPHTHTYFLSTMLWGVVGPRRLFGPGAPYNAITYCIPVGVILPVAAYYAAKRWPSSFWRNVSTPILIAGPLGWAPYNWTYMQGSVILGFFFNYYIKRRYGGWWERYAYVMTSSFSAAIGIAGLIIFFGLQKWEVRLDWWGNLVSGMGVDGGGWRDAQGNKVTCVYKKLPPGGVFETGF